jgi:hypothetical protein
MKYLFITALYVLMLSPYCMADEGFNMPFTLMNTSAVLGQTCGKVQDEVQMDEKVASSLVLWVGLCQPELLQKWVSGASGMFKYDNGNFYWSDGQLATPHEVMEQYFTLFGQIEVKDSMPTDVMPFHILEFPLIIYDHNPSDHSIKVWTDFPKEMPIGSLLNNPQERKLFCDAGKLPAREFYTTTDTTNSYGILRCEIGTINSGVERPSSRLPSIPSAPRGRNAQETARNAVCHQLRIRATKLGYLSHAQLMDLTAENTVPVFRRIDDPLSDVVGIEPCIQNSLATKVKKVDAFKLSVLPDVKITPAMQRSLTTSSDAKISGPSNSEDQRLQRGALQTDECIDFDSQKSQSLSRQKVQNLHMEQPITEKPCWGVQR